MNASATVEGAVSERRPYEFSLPTKKFDLKEFLIALAFVGDVAMILGGLVFGFWIRFRSGWINWGNEPAGLEFVDYSGLMGLDGGIYMSSLRSAVDFHDDVLGSLLKAVVFGVIVGLVATYRGYTCAPNSEGVSTATTQTVVVASVSVLIFDYFITALWGI